MPDPDAGGAAPSPPRWAPVSLASVVSADTATQLPLVAPTDPYIGRIIGGKYRILDRLGAGGMAVVYRAQEQGMLTREVAIKVLTPESALSQATISRFLKEAQAISDVGHANVVQLIELGRTEEGQIYLVMERLVGKTLYEVIKQMAGEGQTFTWDRLAPLILQICRALHAAHKQKIIHRDIKPSNVFCCDLEDEQWHIKVLDFGIAKVQSSSSSDSVETPLTQEGMFLGTPHYAAPEIINRRPEHTIDGRVDIFALGVIMYQCLTGTLPFQDFYHDRLALMYKSAHERPEPPRQRAPELEIPAEVEAIIMRAMELDLDRRYRSVPELMEAIRATLRSGGHAGNRTSIVELTPPPPSEQAAGAPAPPRNLQRSSLRHEQTPAQPRSTPAIVSPPESPTVQSLSRRTTQGVLLALAAMLCGLIVLVVLIVRDLGTPAPPPRSPPVRPPAAPAGHLTRLEPARADKSASPAEPPAPATPAAAAPEDAPRSPEPAVEPVEVAPDNPRTTPSAPSEAARRRSVRARLDKLVREPWVADCLPMSTSYADGVFDALPVLLDVDAEGRATASIPARVVERRVSKIADGCVLKMIAATRFAPGPAPIKVSHTLLFD